MIHFFTGGAGCGKSCRIMELIKKYSSEGRDIITIVPEQFSYEFDRKLYNRIGPLLFNQIETHSFTSLARGIFQRLGGGAPGSYMDELMQTGLVLQAVRRAEGQLKTFAKQCGRSEFASEAAAIISVLRRSGIDSEQLMMKCSSVRGRLFDKTSDIAAIYHQYEMLLIKHGLKDMLTDITEAASIANGNDFFAGKIVFIDEFESFTPDQYEMLSVIIGLADEVYIAFRMESEDEQELSLFGSVGAACRKVRSIASDYRIPYEFVFFTEQHRMKHSDLKRLSESVFRPVKASPSGVSQHIHIVEASTPFDEAEFVCAAIKRKLHENPDMRCGDIAVVTENLADYAGILEHAMERCGLPCHIDMPRPVLHTPFMVYITSLMSLMRKKEPDTELLLRCGKSGFTDCSLTELSMLENYCYVWSIDGSMWNEPFTCGEESAEIEAVRRKLLAPVHSLKNKCRGCSTSADYSRCFYSFLEELDAGVRAESLFQEADTGRQLQMKQDFKRVWDSLMDILDILAELSDGSCTSSDYFTMLHSMLKTVSHAVPPRTLDAVVIAPAGTSRLSEPRITFVLGACEGCFPKNSKGSSLFSERERLELEQQGVAIGQPPELSAADERLAVYKILSSASDELYLCYPLKDSGDSRCLRSSIADLALSLFDNSYDMMIYSKNLPTSFFAVTKAAAYYHYVQDFSKRDSDIASIQTLLYEDEYYAGRIDYLRSVHDDADFTVNPVLMERLTGSSIILTASRLESFRMCPFQYFCRYALRLYERRKIHLGNAESGSLVHACMEQLLRGLPREEFLSLTEQQLSERILRLSGEYWTDVLGGDFQQNLREAAALEHINQGMTDFARHLQQELAQSEFYPEYFEAEISGRSSDFPSPRLVTADGHPVIIQGIADRVDVMRREDEEWVRVVDYKTGGKKFSVGNLIYGLDMQMLLYLFAVTGENAKLSSAKPAGVLYLPAGIPECTSERGSTGGAEKAIAEQYRMNGLFIDKPDIIRSMDKSLSGMFITPKLLKSGDRFDSRSGDFLSESQMKQLRRYTSHKVIETAESIYSGDAAVSPLCVSGRDACAFCSYSGICGNGDKHRSRTVIDKADALKKQFFEELSDTDE